DHVERETRRAKRSHSKRISPPTASSQEAAHELLERPRPGFLLTPSPLASQHETRAGFDRPSHAPRRTRAEGEFFSRDRAAMGALLQDARAGVESVSVLAQPLELLGHGIPTAP